MNKICFLLYTLFSCFAFGQIPQGYYDTANGLTGYSLKTELKNIISTGHIDQGYDGLYTAYVTSDRDTYFENDNSLLDMYSEKPTASDSYTYDINDVTQRCGGYSQEGDCYNREHVIPSSVFGNAFPMRSDVHQVIPSDGYVNSIRGSFPFGRTSNPNYTTTNGSERGDNQNSGYSAGYVGVVFEPIDEFKGDFARMHFYFATRYEDQVTNWTYDMLDGSNNQVFTDTFKSILLTWHQMDPVSQKEIDRNNAAYTFQGNRNPYIDNPQFIANIWGNLGLEEVDFQPTEYIELYPTQASSNQILTVKRLTEIAIEKISIFSINGVLMQQNEFQNNEEEVEILLQLEPGVYIVKTTGKGFEVNRKIIIK